MSDTPEAAGNGAAPPQIVNRVVGQYIRDMSFENIMMQKGVTGEVQPEIQIGVSMDARKRGAEKHYEISTKLKVTSKNKGSGETLFILELDYAGLFFVDGVPEEQLHAFLMIECPRMTFPFLRRVVSDITRDGGYPPLNLDNIDFRNVYLQDLQRRAQAQAAEKAQA